MILNQWEDAIITQSLPSPRAKQAAANGEIRASERWYEVPQSDRNSAENEVQVSWLLPIWASSFLLNSFPYRQIVMLILLCNYSKSQSFMCTTTCRLLALQMSSGIKAYIACTIYVKPIISMSFHIHTCYKVTKEYFSQGIASFSFNQCNCSWTRWRFWGWTFIVK